jgi:hypothetical protein
MNELNTHTVPVSDEDDVSVSHINAKHQVEAFYQLFIDKQFDDAAAVAVGLAASAREMARKTYAAKAQFDRLSADGQRAVIAAVATHAAEAQGEEAALLITATNKLVASMQEA